MKYCTSCKNGVLIQLMSIESKTLLIANVTDFTFHWIWITAFVNFQTTSWNLPLLDVYVTSLRSGFCLTMFLLDNTCHMDGRRIQAQSTPGDSITTTNWVSWWSQGEIQVVQCFIFCTQMCEGINSLDDSTNFFQWYYCVFNYVQWSRYPLTCYYCNDLYIYEFKTYTILLIAYFSFDNCLKNGDR